MIPQPLAGADPCQISEQWGISIGLARPLIAGANMLEQAGLGILLIISGMRSEAQQDALRRAGRRPTAPNDRSTHLSCPATGADISLPSITDGPESDGLKFTVVAVMEGQGLRVGGGGPVQENGLPLDWNHVDLGPRVA